MLNMSCDDTMARLQLFQKQTNKNKNQVGKSRICSISLNFASVLLFTRLWPYAPSGAKRSDV